MTQNRAIFFAILGLAVVVMFYYANANDGGKTRPIPAVQGEAQLMGMGVKADVDLPLGTNAGTPLDMRPEIHFWAPGFPGAGCMDENHPCVKTPHRYPAVPGGNLSTIMHKGWSSLWTDAPADNDWRLNPPEVSVL